jgi:hypothetical protein
MTPQKFQETHLDQWILRRAAIEPTMMESASMMAKTWNGRLQAKNIWFCGEQMVSHKASNKNPNKWWDGINPTRHRLVVLEEDPHEPQGDMLAVQMKIWCDRYRFIAEIKTSALQVRPERFAIRVALITSEGKCRNQKKSPHIVLNRVHNPR